MAWQTGYMRIVVCVKHVPDADSDRRIEDGRMVRGEDDVLNELDENAVEAAVSLVEENGGEVVALTMGPEDAEDALVRALQMGADRAVLISDDAFAGLDAPRTAAVLAAAIKALDEDDPVDLVLTGMASLDGMTSLLAPALAAKLAWPLLDIASSLEVEDGKVRIERRVDGSVDILRASTPAVVSVTDQANEPRYPSFKDLRAARSKPVDEWEAADLEDAGLDLSALEGGLEVTDATMKVREAGVIVTDSSDGGTKLAEFLNQAADK